MTRSKERFALAVAVLLMASPVLAQSTAGTTSGGTTSTSTAAGGSSTSTGSGSTTTTTTGGGTATTGSAGGTSTTGAFKSLSPGQQKIARALFLAQHPTANGPAPLSLDQIAALRQHEGWGQVFHQMKSEGLVESKNLGQVVSHYEHHVHMATTHTQGGTSTASGRSGMSGSEHHHDGDDAMDKSRHTTLSHNDHDRNDVTMVTAGGKTTSGGTTTSTSFGGTTSGGKTSASSATTARGGTSSHGYSAHDR